MCPLLLRGVAGQVDVENQVYQSLLQLFAAAEVLDVVNPDPISLTFPRSPSWHRATIDSEPRTGHEAVLHQEGDCVGDFLRPLRRVRR
jgi:hypothetical protein